LMLGRSAFLWGAVLLDKAPRGAIRVASARRCAVDNS
jgi:hypothetical protein